MLTNYFLSLTSSLTQANHEYDSELNKARDRLRGAETELKKPGIAAKEYANLEKALVATRQENSMFKDKIRLLEENSDKLRTELKGSRSNSLHLLTYIGYRHSRTILFSHVKQSRLLYNFKIN